MINIAWCDVFDARKMFLKDWNEVLRLVRQTDYQYILFNGQVLDLNFNKVCMPADLLVIL